MNEQSSAVVIELAKSLIDLARKIEPKWNKAFFRFSLDEAKYGSNGSYIVGSEVIIFDPFLCGETFFRMNEEGVKLLKLLDKSRGVFLVRADSSFDYDIKFEFQDLERWKITKLDGGTGLPEGE